MFWQTETFCYNHLHIKSVNRSRHCPAFATLINAYSRPGYLKRYAPSVSEGGSVAAVMLIEFGIPRNELFDFLLSLAETFLTLPLARLGNCFGKPKRLLQSGAYQADAPEHGLQAFSEIIY